MTQIERIQHMEQILNEAKDAVQALTSALERYQALKPRMVELTAYYSSPQWMKDYEDDEAGRLPEGMARGVLSEDAVYNLLYEQRVLMDMMKEA